MSLTKSLLTTTCCYCLFTAIVQAETPVASTYQCPDHLQLGSLSYALEGTSVYDGPIEDRAMLKPEPVPDDDRLEPSFWDYGDYSNIFPEATLYLKCRYKNIEHYLVLKAKGARRCTFTAETHTECK